jgi:uncharacterized protein YjdB
MLVVATLGCHDLTLNPDHVVTLVAHSADTVAVGDTLRLAATALNALGQPVTSATITWALLDTGAVKIRLDASGLVTAVDTGAARVQAEADNLRSDPIIVTVIAPASSSSKHLPSAPVPLSPKGEGTGVRQGVR